MVAVTSRAIFDAPITWPAAPSNGEIVTDTSIGVPSLRTRTVSKWSTRSPRRSRSRIRTRSAPVYAERRVALSGYATAKDEAAGSDRSIRKRPGSGRWPPPCGNSSDAVAGCARPTRLRHPTVLIPSPPAPRRGAGGHGRRLWQLVALGATLAP